MAVFKRGGTYHYEFLFAGKRIRESAHTSSKTVAKEAEKTRRRELERTLAGLPAEKREDRIQSVNDVVIPRRLRTESPAEVDRIREWTAGARHAVAWDNASA